jgi:hypothetical protein
MARFGLLASVSVTLLVGAAAPAAAAPGDSQLAFHYRPYLKFDSEERWRPLDVEAFFAESRLSRQHHLCLTSSGPCDVVATQPGDLNQGRVLDVAGERREGADYVDGGTRSAIYYDVFRRRGRPIIDYWWFLRYNDFPYADELKCRERTPCSDHEGDWEGVRVIPPHGPEALEVHYDAHGRSESYFDLEPELVDGRPVVYIALGTHAAYPRACSPPRLRYCRQSGAKLPDGRFNGEAPWARNSNSACGKTCLLPLPPGSWTTWPGLWGRACDRGSCRRAKGPKSPRLQDHRSAICLLDRTRFRSIRLSTAIGLALKHVISHRKECR